MENSYFLFSTQNIEISRLHLCTWEFQDESALMEIGGEISAENLRLDVSKLEMKLFIPWLKSRNTTDDLYPRLKDAANTKFIFNDSVHNTHSLDDGRNLLGVVHIFTDREPLCILPSKIKANYDKKTIDITLDLSAYYNSSFKGTNIYFRFSISAQLSLLSIRKRGTGSSTIIYDFRFNEGRSIPDALFEELQTQTLCNINTFFFLTILPNSYDVAFLDPSALKNVRTLEYDAFKRYLGDKRVKKNSLMVVFSKKKFPDSFTFFSIFRKERIGAGQFALAILINLITGILLFLPSFRKENSQSLSVLKFLKQLPFEVCIAIGLSLLMTFYLVWPSIMAVIGDLKMKFRKSNTAS